MNEKPDALTETLTREEREEFDKMAAMYPDEDPEILAIAAKNKAAAQKLAEEQAAKTREVYDLADRQELCLGRYSNAHPELDCDTKKKLIRVFFACKDPEKLMELTPAEILKTLE